MKLIKKFTEGKFANYKICKVKSGFAVYLHGTLIKTGLEDYEECLNAIIICNKRYDELQNNLIQCAIQAYRKTEEHTMCLCKDPQFLEHKKKCGHCEMVGIFENNLRNVLKL